MSPLENEKTIFEFWRKSITPTSDNDPFKKPFTPKLNSQTDKDPSGGLDERYLNPSTPRNTTEIGLDQILGTTIGDVSQNAIDAFDWANVFNISKGNPKTSMELPSNVTLDASFFKGAMSGRSTSIGSGSIGNKSRTLDEKFEDFSKQSLENIKMTDDEFGPVANDNLALIEEAEKIIEEDNQFMQEDAMTDAPGVSFAQPNQTTEIFDVTSRSQYFSKNTSR